MQWLRLLSECISSATGRATGKEEKAYDVESRWPQIQASTIRQKVSGMERKACESQHYLPGRVGRCVVTRSWYRRETLELKVPSPNLSAMLGKKEDAVRVKKLREGWLTLKMASPASGLHVEREHTPRTQLPRETSLSGKLHQDEDFVRSCLKRGFISMKLVFLRVRAQNIRSVYRITTPPVRSTSWTGTLGTQIYPPFLPI